MLFISNPMQRETSIKTYPIQKSNSAVALILHGDSSSNKADCKMPKYSALEAFHKDYAAIDREFRKKQETRKAVSLESRKQAQLTRQQSLKDQETRQLNNMKERQINSQHLYKIGEKATVLKYGIPMDPISCQYQNSQKGRQLANSEAEKGLNRLVRAHHLQTMGTSGYNIVTGRNSMDVYRLVPPHSQVAYEHKLEKLYSRYKISPNDL